MLRRATPALGTLLSSLLFTIFSGFLVVPVQASPQLDLPKAKEKEKPAKRPKKSSRDQEQRGNLVPHLSCTVCYSRNYDAAPTVAREKGVQDVYCQVCRRSTAHKFVAAGAGRGGDLELPKGDRPSVVPIPEPAGTGAGTQPLQVSPTLSEERAAIYVFDEVRRAAGAEADLSLAAVETLLDLGEVGVQTARRHLRDPEAQVALTAARVLWRSGDPGDSERLAGWLESKVPARAGAALVADFVKYDPVRATPEFLSRLLDHNRVTIRNAAFEELSKRVDPQSLPAVAKALESKRASTRRKAIELIGLVDDPAVPDLLLSRLSDPNARVANDVVQRLASVDDERIEIELLSRAFGERWILRGSAYSLLAILQREDTKLQPILTHNHVPALLEGMRANDPFVSGVCAAALAGIGFRSQDPAQSDWLEMRVPEALVSAVSGQVYHDDFSSLQPVAQNRLRLLSGQALGSSGPKWVEWWLGQKDNFYPHRAFVPVTEGDEPRITILFREQGTGEDTDAFELIGSAVAEERSATPRRAPERLFLSEQQSRALAAALRREGVFGAQRLPGLRGRRGFGTRTLSFELDGRGKEFVFAEERSEDWFTRLESTVLNLRAKNRWQRYPDPEKHIAQLDLWKEEASWWDETPMDGGAGNVARARRLQDLLIPWLQAREPRERTEGLAELARLHDEAGVTQAEDFDVLLDLLQDEPFLADRGRLLTGLVLRAALPLSAESASEDSTGEENRDAPAAEDLARVDRLVDYLHKTFGADALDPISQALESAGVGYVREQLSDERSLLRVVAATVLAERGEEEDDVRLLALLEDPSLEVQLSAIRVLGEKRVMAAADELLLRARLAAPSMRVPALEAVGRLGGEGAFETLQEACSDTNPLVRVAAVSGLAELGDPRAASFLIGVLGQGDRSAGFAAARRGLQKMGQGAHTDLLQVSYSPAHRARREATLLLSEQLVPDAASTLITLLTDEPDDVDVSWELSVLSARDLRIEPDAALAWWDWWDTVDHKNAWSWFAGALSDGGLVVPPETAFEGEGTREGIEFLLEQLELDVACLSERARRELERLTGLSIAYAPGRDGDRQAWLDAVRARVRAGREVSRNSPGRVRD